MFPIGGASSVPGYFSNDCFVLSGCSPVHLHHYSIGVVFCRLLLYNVTIFLKGGRVVRTKGGFSNNLGVVYPRDGHYLDACNDYYLHGTRRRGFFVFMFLPRDIYRDDGWVRYL